MIGNLKRLVKNIFSKKEIHKLISKKEIENLLKKERFQSGLQKFLSNKLRYSDNLGFIHSVEEIFIDECYKFNSNKSNPIIIDCGSNIGLSIIYFKKMYPSAKIIGFEPDRMIFEMLTYNVSSFNLSDVKLINKAVSINDEPIFFFSEGSLAGSTIVDFEGKNNIQKIEACRLKDYLKEEIDFLKIDIEGAENSLIFDLEPELCNVRQIFIEYHSTPKLEQCLGELLGILRNAGFRYYIKEASCIMRHPFIDKTGENFDMQLNIFGYRTK